MVTAGGVPQFDGGPTRGGGCVHAGGGESTVTLRWSGLAVRTAAAARQTRGGHPGAL